MGRLFWKIFLGFWLTTAIIIVTTTIVLSLLVERSEPDRTRARQEARLETSAITAQLLLNQGGASALRDWLREQNARGSNSLWLLDERGRDLLGRRPPPLLRHAAQSDRRYAHRGVVAATITGPDGANFRLLAPPAVRGAPDRPGVLVIGVPIALFASGCQWRSKKGPPRRCKKGPLGGCGLVPVVHGRAPRATRRALNRLTRRRAREGPVGPRGQAWAGWSVQLAVGV